jgi:hypothetical protein
MVHVFMLSVLNPHLMLRSAGDARPLSMALKHLSCCHSMLFETGLWPSKDTSVFPHLCQDGGCCYTRHMGISLHHRLCASKRGTDSDRRSAAPACEQSDFTAMNWYV